MKNTIKNKGIYITLLFLVQTSCMLSLIILFKNNFLTLLNAKTTKVLLGALDARFILSVLLTLIISMVVYGLLSKITFEEILNKKNHRPIIIQLFQYFLMYIAFNLVIIAVGIGLGLTLIILIRIPLLGPIFFILCVIVFSFYYHGYYRFIPYIAMAEGMEDVFGKSKRYIKGHLMLSIILLIFNSGLYEIFINLELDAFRNEKMVLFIVLLIIYQIILFSLIFFDIAFVFTCSKQGYIDYHKPLEPFTENQADDEITFRMSDLD